MRGLHLSLALAFLLSGCGGVDVVKGSIQGEKFEEVLDVTFDKATVVDANGVASTVGITVLYSGENGFCQDLNDAVNGDEQALNRILRLDQLAIFNFVGEGQNPDLEDADVSASAGLSVVGIFDASQGGDVVFDGFLADAGTITMDFDTGEGSLNVEFAGDKVSVDVLPLNFQCSGMAELFFSAQ